MPAHRLALTATVALCLGLAGCPAQPSEAPSESAAKDESIPVVVDEVRRESLSSLYSTSATLRAEREATVLARTRGVIRRLLVEEGDTVAAGQALVELEDDEQRIERDRTRDVAQARQRELQRAEELHSRGALSDNDFEDARTVAAEATHQAELAALRLERTVIQAPFGGKILRRHLDAGATVADGTPVLDLADVDPLMADVRVPERHVAPLAVGQSVRLVADAGGEAVEARIERIAPVVDASTGTVKVTLALVDSSSLRPGAFVRVDVVVDTHPDALVVPRAALVAVGQRWFLFRAEAGGRAKMLEVETGFEEGDRIEISSSSFPLEPGQRVVVVGAAALSEGSVLDVMEDRSLSAPPAEPPPEEEDQGKRDAEDERPDPA